jgi:hypothetical protein
VVQASLGQGFHGRCDGRRGIDGCCAERIKPVESLLSGLFLGKQEISAKEGCFRANSSRFNNGRKFFALFPHNRCIVISYTTRNYDAKIKPDSSAVEY